MSCTYFPLRSTSSIWAVTAKDGKGIRNWGEELKWSCSGSLSHMHTSTSHVHRWSSSFLMSFSSIDCSVNLFCLFVFLNQTFHISSEFLRLTMARCAIDTVPHNFPAGADVSAEVLQVLPGCLDKELSCGALFRLRAGSQSNNLYCSVWCTSTFPGSQVKPSQKSQPWQGNHSVFWFP